MLLFSWLLNVALFFALLNLSYFKNKRKNPDYPDKPFSKLVLFPVALGTVFTLIVDAFRGIIFYQFLLFVVAAILLYWIFYHLKPR
ncbi:MAG: hypothetical protein GX790_01915 [Syntrophomonadaceae bacterium]|nr:hypothetical protein [Syntrophomonadaceae bacterium]